MCICTQGPSRQQADARSGADAHAGAAWQPLLALSYAMRQYTLTDEWEQTVTNCYSKWHARREWPLARPLAETCRSLAARTSTDLPLSAATALWSAAGSSPPCSSRIVTAGLPSAARKHPLMCEARV